MGHRPAASLSVAGAQHWWIKAAFLACLAWRSPEHRYQCNWVARMSSCMCAGKRLTLRATIVTIISHMTTDVSVFVKCDMIFRLFFFVNYHKFELLTFAVSVATYSRYGGKYYMGFVGNSVLITELYQFFHTAAMVANIVTKEHHNITTV